MNEPTDEMIDALFERASGGEFETEDDLIHGVMQVVAIARRNQPAILDDAIRLLEELKASTESDEWQYPPMKRAVLSGVTLSIQRLKNAQKEPDCICPAYEGAIHKRRSSGCPNGLI